MAVVVVVLWCVCPICTLKANVVSVSVRFGYVARDGASERPHNVRDIFSHSRCPLCVCVAALRARVAVENPTAHVWNSSDAYYWHKDFPSFFSLSVCSLYYIPLSLSLAILYGTRDSFRSFVFFFPHPACATRVSSFPPSPGYMYMLYILNTHTIYLTNICRAEPYIVYYIDRRYILFFIIFWIFQLMRQTEFLSFSFISL